MKIALKKLPLTKSVTHIGAALALLTTGVLIYLLIRATDHNTLNDQNIQYLLLFNGAVALSLLTVILTMAWRLRQRLREGRFGSKLLIKLAAIFALVGVLPGVLIYSVSYQFVSRSIASWFDLKVETALEAGLALGRATLERSSADLSSRVRIAIKELQLDSGLSMTIKLDRLREQISADDAQVWSHTGALIASSGESHFQVVLDKPTSEQMRRLKSVDTITTFEGLDSEEKNSRIRLIAAFNPPGFALRAEPMYLVVSEFLPANLVTNALAVQNAYTEYQERALAREGLQKMYIGTLTLSLFLAVLGAFILAVVLGNQLVRPLLLLAQGVERVSAGDLSPQLMLSDDDELADLTRSFASMTQQLADARLAEQKNERVKAWNEVAQRVAHEIKNPLTPIRLSAERLAMRLSDKLQGADLALLEKSVKTIVDQVEAMKRLVNEFRNYARLPSAQLQPIALQSVIQETLLLYEHEVQQGKIQLTVQSDLPKIQGDPEQLRQVFHNLIQNALDAMRTQVTMTLGVDSALAAIYCDIQDDGAGFAPHILERAFEPYNTTKPRGTGLGLAMVKKIIQEHQGTISLSNRADAHSGARVHLLFPITVRSFGG